MCSSVDYEMVRIGVLVFCMKCAANEFRTLDPVREERERYLHFLRVYEKIFDEE
uniref:Uncharacterized protein n=1 Tax=viral metagenome TaxID=1070528 RepID=A0A6M3XFM8_9ZZZZ